MAHTINTMKEPSCTSETKKERQVKSFELSWATWVDCQFTFHITVHFFSNLLLHTYMYICTVMYYDVKEPTALLKENRVYVHVNCCQSLVVMWSGYFTPIQKKGSRWLHIHCNVALLLITCAVKCLLSDTSILKGPQIKL